MYLYPQNLWKKIIVTISIFIKTSCRLAYFIRNTAIAFQFRVLPYLCMEVRQNPDPFEIDEKLLLILVGATTKTAIQRSFFSYISLSFTHVPKIQKHELQDKQVKPSKLVTWGSHGYKWPTKMQAGGKQAHGISTKENALYVTE